MIRAGDCEAWLAYLTHPDSKGDSAFARRIVAEVRLPVPLPPGDAGRAAVRAMVRAIAVSATTPEDDLAHDLYGQCGLDMSPHVRDVVDALLPEEHSERIVSGDTMTLARAAAAYVWAQAHVADHRVDVLARVFAMPREAMITDTLGTAEDIASRFDVSIADALARLHDLENRVESPPSSARGDDANARKKFVAWYGGELYTPEEAAARHEAALLEWYAFPIDWNTRPSETQAARDRIDREFKQARFYPRGWHKVHNEIARERRRAERANERAPSSGVRTDSVNAAVSA